MSTLKFPRGYTRFQWNPATEKFNAVEGKSVRTTDFRNMSVYSTEQKDTTLVSEIILDSNFKNEDILDNLLPAQLTNVNFLRPVRGSAYNSFLEVATKKKSANGFVTVSSYSGRETLPFGYRYSNSFSFYVTCEQTGNNSSMEVESKGRKESDFWITDGHVIQKTCGTGDIIQEWKYTYKFDTHGNLVDDMEYMKQNGDFVLNYHIIHEFDDKDREKTYISEFENKKYEFTYDEYENAIASQFKWNGSEWIQTHRTVKTIDLTDVTTITYTDQEIINGNWTDRWRTLYKYDAQKRLVFTDTEYINPTSHDWYVDSSFKLKYYKDNLVQEEEFYFKGSGANRTTYQFNANDKVIHSETSFCDGDDNCSMGIYDPLYKADYALPASDTLDYLRSWLFDKGAYQQLDSIANVYDSNGDLKEMYYEYFPANQRDRYKFVYDAVASINEEAPEIAVYPNPAKNSLFVQTQWKDYTVRIYDFKGILMSSYSDPQGPLDISSIPEGLYVLQVESGTKRFRTKIAVK
ncbi:hypothetical protein WSM22_27080 [Cytophagales bacterium WSM2-2]|nr:hypothetical protein WSM22_27080 [Cytophagales bacterium WSM2-2]